MPCVLTRRPAFGIILAVKHPLVTRLLRQLPVLALGVLLAACSGTTVPIPVINPPVTPALGQIPTQQPAATPTPTLTPAETLDEAQRLLYIGDYEVALQSFHALTLDPSVPSEVIAEAYFGQGQAALQQGAFAAAQAAFDSFLAAYPTHPKAPIATFMRGDAKLGVSDWAWSCASG
jgi:TolA-binding protein